jgi:protein-disulfide isomerase
MTARRSLSLVTLEVLALAGLLAMPGHAAAPATAAPAMAAQPVEPAAGTVVGTIGKETITWAQLLAHGKDALAAQQQLQEQARLHLLEQASHERYGTLEAQLGQWLDDRALAAEAAVQKSTPEALLAAITPDAVNESEMRQTYEARKGANDPPWETARPQVGERVRQFLAAQHVEQAHRRYLDGLRALHGISAQLPPYRVVIPAGGPMRGKAGAPVTLVEFGDFQCPYCQRAQPVVQALLAQHPDDLQLVFHHFPLARVHPNARSAAFAAECARQQGKFWELHDAMYADQDQLAPQPLQATAERIGLDGPAFARCFADPATVRVVDADLKVGAAAGVNGTPSFFINGRPVSSDPASLERVVAEELARRRAAP